MPRGGKSGLGVCGGLSVDPPPLRLVPNGGASSGWWIMGVRAGLGIRVSLSPTAPELEGGSVSFPKSLGTMPGPP